MSGKKLLPVSILIPTMNRPKALKRTIDCYLKGQYIPSQIVVVDQSEHGVDRDSIRQLVEEYSLDTEMVYIYQDIPSLTKARNTASKYAKQEIIIYSDDDIDVYDDTIKNIHILMQNPGLALIAGIDDNTKHSSSKIGYLLGTKSFHNRKIGHVTSSMLGRFPNEIEEVTDTMWAMGFFFVIRKSLMEKWNLKWDENLTGYAYAEDLDFSYSYYKKAKNEHLNCIMSNKAHVKHLASQEYRTPSRESTFMYVLHRYYLCKKHAMGIWGFIAIFWCNLWMYIQRRIKGQGDKDMLDAIRYYYKHKKEIYAGKFECLKK